MSEAKCRATTADAVERLVRRGRGSGRAANRRPQGGQLHVKRGEPSPRSAGEGESVGMRRYRRIPASALNDQRDARFTPRPRGVKRSRPRSGWVMFRLFKGLILVE